MYSHVCFLMEMRLEQGHQLAQRSTLYYRLRVAFRPTCVAENAYAFIRMQLKSRQRRVAPIRTRLQR